MLAKFYEFQTKANIYHAYHTIQRYTDEPFTSYMPEALFNISRYLMHELLNESAVPKGVSRFAVLYALAKQSRNLGKNFELSCKQNSNMFMKINVASIVELELAE